VGGVSRVLAVCSMLFSSGCDLVLQLDRPGGAEQYIQFVQVNAVTGPPATEVAVPFLGSQAAGNLNVAVVGWTEAGGVVSVSDQNGDYVLAVAPLTQGQLRQAIYYRANIAAATPGANVITVTFSEETTFPDVRIVEYAGIDPVDPFDVSASQGGISVDMTTGFAVTTHAHDLVVAAAIVDGTTVAPGNGFVGRIITVPNGSILEDMEVTEKGRFSATATQNAPVGWVMQLAAFRGQ